MMPTPKIESKTIHNEYAELPTLSLSWTRRGGDAVLDEFEVVVRGETLAECEASFSFLMSQAEAIMRRNPHHEGGR